MKNSAETLHKPKTLCIIVAFLCSCVIMPVHGQDACQSECVKDLYARNCGGASCITGVSSSQEFESLCGNACISAISGGGMLDCLIAIGGSTSVQNNFVLNVQSFCANGDPFVPNTRGVIATSDDLSTVEVSPSPNDSEDRSSNTSFASSASETTSSDSSTSVEPADSDPPMEEASMSARLADSPIPTLTPNPAESSIVPPNVESPAHASDIAEVEPPSSEEAYSDAPEAPISGVEIESHETNSNGPVFEFGPESGPGYGKEPDPAPPSTEEPTSPDSAPAIEPSIPSTEPPVPVPEPAVESSLPEFEADDYTLENDSLMIIEEGFNALQSDDED